MRNVEVVSRDKVLEDLDVRLFPIFSKCSVFADAGSNVQESSIECGSESCLGPWLSLNSPRQNAEPIGHATAAASVTGGVRVVYPDASLVLSVAEPSACDGAARPSHTIALFIYAIV